MIDMPPFIHTLAVRFGDCDMYRHVNNAVYLTYFEEARGYFWRELRGAAFTGYDFIVAEITCTYRAPAVVGEALAIAVTVDAVGTKSFTLGYRITGQGERLIATGRSVQVAYDHEAQRSHPLPADVRASLEARR
jgi:acyl-CoA thioester hydrolase